MSLPQRLIEKMSVMLGSPGYVAASVVFMVGWIVVNLAAIELGYEAVDEPPFFWLQGIKLGDLPTGQWRYLRPDERF